MGSAALAHLARRGARALGIEQFELGHARGSSHGESRIIRKAYFEHPDYVPLLHRAYELWRELQDGRPEPLFHEGVGVLTCGPEESVVVAGTREAARRHGLPIEDVEPDEAARRWPSLRVPAGYRALWDPDGGILRPEACVAAHVDVAREAGAVAWERTPVLSFRRDGATLVVDTARGPVTCERLVVAAGPWSGQVLRSLGLPLRLRRMVVFWHRPRDPAAFLPDRFPAFLLDLPGALVYGIPDLGTGVKVADHAGGQDVATPDIERGILPGDADSCVRAIASCLPGLHEQAERHAACLYTMTPDQHFIVDRHPEDPAVVVAAGFSGHGFKFAAVVGEVLADLALDGRTSLDVGFLGLSRWSRDHDGEGGPC